MTKIYQDLYQFTDILEPMKLSMHQYLLLTEEPILIQTGSNSQAQKTLPQIEQLLNGKKLKYILISHFESDECGGLSLVLNKYPDAVAICSETTARQLWGFDITQNIEIKKPGEKFYGKDFNFKIIGYPSEMHMWEGLLFTEIKRNIFFSSDLMFQIGENHGTIIEKTWLESINSSGNDNLPTLDMQEKLKKDLKNIDPKFVASGHGPCIKIIA